MRQDKCESKTMVVHKKKGGEWVTSDYYMSVEG
jgi:hypothetical protein